MSGDVFQGPGILTPASPLQTMEISVMKTARNILLMLAVSLLAFSVIGCGDEATTRNIEAENTSRAATKAEHPGSEHPSAEHPGQQAAAALGGEILETMDSGGYSYVHLDMGVEKVWIAGPTTPGLKVGDRAAFEGAMEMRNFHAKSLDRTFETILFVGLIGKEGEVAAGSSAGGMHGGMGGMGGAMGSPDEPISGTKTMLENAGVEGVVKAAGGYTVGEIYAQAADLGGKEILLSARVVKFSSNIMGTNWLHVQDGSGDEATSDLTVTTDGHAQVGDLVLVMGKLSVDKDFGAGYKYHVIIEGATVTKQ